MENYTAKCEMSQCRWQYLENGQYKNYNDEDHMLIESGFEAQTNKVELRHNYSRVTVDLKARTQKSRYGSSTKIRRWVKLTHAELREFRNKADRDAFMRKSGNSSKLKALFNKYLDVDYDATEDDEPYIGQDGIISIGKQLGIDPATDIEILVLSWLMDCNELGMWTQNEFFLGLSRLKCTSISQVKRKVPTFKSMIADTKKFKDFYTWCFLYFKESAQKGLTREMAAAAWGLVLKGRCSLLPEVVEFMETYDRGISLDTWQMMLDFSRDVKRDLTGWNEVYPPFFDDFVEWLDEEKDIQPQL